MEKVLRQLFIWICTPIYKLIPTIYDVFYKLANHRFFEDDTIEQLSSNIYVLVSVVMLFVFSANLLAAIVNPDLMNDKKKGVGALFKRSILGIMLIVLTPLLFDKAYDIQKNVMDKSLIEKVLVGINYTDEENKGGNGGQVIAGTLINSVLYPIEDNIEVSEDISKEYSKMVSEDISYISDVADHINIAPTDGSHKFAFEFEYLVALIAGGICLYMLLIFAFDMAVRAVKLAFLELTAPISIISYIAAGDDVLKKWFGEVGKTFLDVFMRIACMAFYIFMIANLDGFINRVNGNWFVKVLLLVGMLIFVKQLPDFINKIFGVNIQSKGGISGRLSAMSGVGTVAKNAWDKTRKTLGNTVKLAGATAIGATGYGLYKGADKISGGRVGELRKNIANATPVRAIGTGLKAVSSGVSAGGGIKGSKELIKSYKDSNYGKQKLTEKQGKELSKLTKLANLNELGKVIDNDNGLSLIQEGTNNLLKKINNDFGLTSSQKEAIKGKIFADQINSLSKKAKESNEKITSQFDTMIANSINNPKVNNELKALKDGYMNGNMKLDNVTARLKKMSELGEIGTAEANNIIANANKLNSVSSAISDIASNTDSTLGKFMKENQLSTFIDDEGKLKSVKIGILSGATETYASNAKTEYEKLTSTASEVNKLAMERYDKTATMVTSEYARKVSEANKPYDSAVNQSSTNSQQNSPTYEQQYEVDNFNIQSSGDLKVKTENKSQDQANQRKDKTNSDNDTNLNDFDKENQQSSYDEQFNHNEYENDAKKESKFKLKDDE